MEYGTETTSYLAPKLWSIVPEIIKNSKSLEPFQLKMRMRKCLCRLCKAFFETSCFNLLWLRFLFHSSPMVLIIHLVRVRIRG